MDPKRISTTMSRTLKVKYFNAMDEAIHRENNNTIMFDVLDKKVKCENDQNTPHIEVKVERLDFDDFDDFDNNNDIYKDHVIKEELVIGPEQIQESFVQTLAVDDIPEKINAKTLYDCQLCVESFQSIQARSTHYKNFHTSLICACCNKTFNKRSNMNRHLNYHCPNNTLTKRNNERKKYGMFQHPFVCDTCGNIYTHKSTIINHIKSKHQGQGPIQREYNTRPIKKYQCHLCKRCYTKNHNLKCHINSQHKNIQDYLCQFCEKGFSWRWALTSHEKNVHMKNKSKAKS